MVVRISWMPPILYGSLARLSAKRSFLWSLSQPELTSFWSSRMLVVVLRVEGTMKENNNCSVPLINWDSREWIFFLEEFFI